MMRWFEISRLGVVRWALLAALTCVVPLRAAYVAKFNHAVLGRIDVYSSDTPENTRKLLCEMMEVRRQVQELVAPVPLPNPRIAVLIFNRMKDYEAFLPKGTGVMARKEKAIAGFAPTEAGISVAVVKENAFGYQFGRDAVLFYYASYLIQYAVPDAPLWVRVGLPEFMAATEYRGNRIRIGGDFMDHRGHIRPARLTPLADLMNDEKMQPFAFAPRHDNAFFHETWGLWQQWLANPDPYRRPQVQRLFAAIREGRKGDLATVAEAFGESAEAIEAARRAPKAVTGFPVLEVNRDADALVAGLGFQPATELDARYAQALLAATTGKVPGDLAYELRQAADTAPDSPRPLEAEAMLATGQQDGATAEVRWERARELGTDNPFAYLQPVRQAIESRPVFLALKPQLPAALCDTWRQRLGRCLELDPGCADAHYYRILVEAFAPEPDAATVEAAERSGSLYIRPLAQVYLAIARWRLGEVAAAHRLLATLKAYPVLGAAGRAQIQGLDDLMRDAERLKK